MPLFLHDASCPLHSLKNLLLKATQSSGTSWGNAQGIAEGIGENHSPPIAWGQTGTESIYRHPLVSAGVPVQIPSWIPETRDTGGTF